MERVLNGAGWRGDQQHHHPRPAPQHRMARTPALSRGSVSVPGHSSFQFPPEMPPRKTNEKDLLRGLNDRFAGFIEKVHHLENQNRALEREIEAIRLKAKSSTSLARQYEPELQDLRRQVREMAVQKYQIELEQKRVEDEFHVLREKCEDEARSKAETQESIYALKKYMDSAYLTQQEMDRKAKALTDEIEFLKRNHAAEVAEIMTQTKETRVGAGLSGFGKGELTAALRDIRTQLEARAICPDTYSEQHFNNQLAKLTKDAETDREALIATKAEISQYRKQLQGKSVELDSVRGMREALERQLYDLEQRHAAEIHHYQDTIRELEQELKNTKYDMSSHVQEYHDLLNVKMALDAEIYSYRKLLEGEESRYCTFSDTQIPVPYIYRQSPIYTLPRVGGVTRKVEPQYKFVEEIITETTREDIEISDAESDDAKEQREEKVAHEKENAGVTTGTEVHLEEKTTQELDAEAKTGSPNADQLDDKEITTKAEEQSPRISADVPQKLKEGGMNIKLSEKNLTTTEQPGKKDTDNSNSKDDDSDKNTKQPDLDAKPEKTQADNRGVQNVAVDSEIKKKDTAKEPDKTSIKQPTPTGQTATQETVTEPEKSATEEISRNSEEEKVKKEPQPTARLAESSTGKPMEKDREINEVKSVEVKASTPEPQRVFQKAEAEKDTLPNSKADSKQTAETLQAEALNTTKAQENVMEVQKEPVEKGGPDATLKSEAKEMKSIEEDKMDGKVEAATEIINADKRDSFQSTEAQKTQGDVSKAAGKQTEAETSERKVVMDSPKAEQPPEKKQAEKMHIKEQPNVIEMETKSEEQSQEANGTKDDKTDDHETEKKIPTKFPEVQKDDVQKDTELKSTEQEAKLEQKTQKQDREEQEREIPTDNKEMVITKQKEQQIVVKTSPEKEDGKDQINTERLSQKSDRTDTEVKQDSTDLDLMKSKNQQTSPGVPKDSTRLEPTDEGQVPREKRLDDSMKAASKKEGDVAAVTENGMK